MKPKKDEVRDALYAVRWAVAKLWIYVFEKEPDLYLITKLSELTTELKRLGARIKRAGRTHNGGERLP